MQLINNDWDYKLILKILFNVTLILLIFVLGFKYIIGLILGMALIIYLFLFPTPIMLMLFSKVFGYDYYKTMFQSVKNESEKNRRNYERRAKVKYKK